MSAFLFGDTSVIVEIGFSTSAGANKVPLGGLLSDIVWTDVTDYVRGISINRGRSTELDQFQTGSASIVLSNADRRFDPLYASGPYYGALTPLRPVQITLNTKDAVGSPLIAPIFFGYVDGWPQSYELFGDATVTVAISDAFKVLNTLTLPGLWEHTIDAEGPLTWLRFNDGETSRVANSGSDGSVWHWSDPEIAGLAKVTGKSTTGLIVDDSNQGGEFTDGTQVFSGDFQTPLPVADRAVELWFQTTQGGSDAYGLCALGALEDLVWGRIVSYLGYGVVQFCIGNSTVAGSTFDVYTSGVLVNDGRPHHVVVNYGTTKSLTVDGVAASRTASNVPTEFVFDGGKVGGKSYLTSTYQTTRSFNGTIDEFLIWGSNLSTATIADHYRLGAGTYATGERTDQRAERILDLIEWPADGRTFGTGLSTVSGVRIQGKTVLEALQAVEAAEQGMLFAHIDGSLIFRTRDDLSRYGSVITFGDAAGENGYQDIVIEQSDADLANRITVSRVDGRTAVKNDTTSQGQYFVRSFEVTDLISDSDEFCEQLAIDLLRRYKAPQTRIRSLSGTIRGKSRSDTADILSVNIGDRVTVKRRPQSVGSAISQVLQIQSTKCEIGPDNLVLSFDLGPAPVIAFILNSATNGVLDTSRLGL